MKFKRLAEKLGNTKKSLMISKVISTWSEILILIINSTKMKIL